MSTYTANTTPNVTNMPTLTGGIGTDELHDFYGHYFLHRNPKSLRLTLLSRTIGVNRIIDELHVAFRHTQGTTFGLLSFPAHRIGSFHSRGV